MFDISFCGCVAEFDGSMMTEDGGLAEELSTPFSDRRLLRLVAKRLSSRVVLSDILGVRNNAGAEGAIVSRACVDLIWNRKEK